MPGRFLIFAYALLVALCVNSRLSTQEIYATEDIRRFLVTAEAQSSGLRGIDHAFAYWLISRAYSGFDAKKEHGVLKESCEAAVNLPAANADSLQTKLEFNCLQRMIAIDPKTGEDLLSRASPNVRQLIRAAGAQKAAKAGDIDKVMELLSSEVSSGASYPYAKAIEAMSSLTNRSDRDRIFAQALSIYRIRHDRGDVGLDDLGTMLVRFWRDLSPGLVLEGIDELLNAAREEGAGDAHLEISVSSGPMNASFSSLYQYRLFQLLAVVRSLDSSRADKIIQDNPSLGKLDSLSPDDQMLSISLHRKNGPAPDRLGAENDFAAFRLRQKAEEILTSAQKNPSLALDNSLMFPDRFENGRSVKADLLLGIARAAQKEHEGVAAKALDELVKLIESYPNVTQCRYLVEAGDRYSQLKNFDKVQDIVRLGMKRVNALYKIDSDSDDPNLALKSSWPSTVISRAFSVLASRVSIEFAETTILEIRDPDQQVFDRIEIAGALLDMPSYPSIMQQQHKEKSSHSIQVFPIPSRSVEAKP